MATWQQHEEAVAKLEKLLAEEATARECLADIRHDRKQQEEEVEHLWRELTQHLFPMSA